MMKNNKGYLAFITAVATLGGLLFGYDTAVISGTVKYLIINFVDPLNLSEIGANSLAGFLISSALIGCVIGGSIGGFLSNRFGRKKSLIIAAVLFVVAAVGSAYPEMGLGKGETHEFLYSFIAYRILGGIGIGLASMLSPMYIAEVAPAEKRGTLVSFNQFAIVSGILIVYFVNYLIALGAEEAWITSTGWRLMFLSGVIPAAIFLFMLFFIPESPRWLVIKGNETKAASIIGRISNSESAKKEIAAVKASIVTVTKSSLFACGVGVVIIGIALSVFQQFVGINVVLYYAPEIFRSMGMGTDAAMLQTIIVGAINVIFTIVAIFTVDRWGRKPLMITGSIGMAVAMLALGTLFFQQSMGMAALLAMLVYVASFAMSWGPICWVLLSEIFPNKVRGQAMAVAVAAQWVANYLVSWTFPMMEKSTYLSNLFHGGFAYWIYGAVAIISAVFVWKLVPETKGKTLEEMNKLFDKSAE